MNSANISKSRRRQPGSIDCAVEWGNSADALRVFGLRESTLRQLWIDGRIESAMLTTRGRKRRGVRLYSFNSIRAALLASQEAAAVK